MSERFDVDIDSERVYVDGVWYARDELASHIKARIEAGDFRVARPGLALEQLDAALATVRVLEVRLDAHQAEQLSRAAALSGHTAAALAREAVRRLISEVAEGKIPSVPATVLTAPVTDAAEALGALPLTQRHEEPPAREHVPAPMHPAAQAAPLPPAAPAQPAARPWTPRQGFVEPEPPAAQVHAPAREAPSAETAPAAADDDGEEEEVPLQFPTPAGAPRDDEMRDTTPGYRVRAQHAQSPSDEAGAGAPPAQDRSAAASPVGPASAPPLPSPASATWPDAAPASPPLRSSVDSGHPPASPQPAGAAPAGPPVMSPVAASPAAAAPIRPGIPVIAPAARAGPPGPPRPPRPAVTNESSKVMVDLGPESDDTQGEAPDKIEREWFDKQ